MGDMVVPEQCQLDRKRLSAIETKLDQVLDNQIEFIAIDGPLGKVRDKVQEVGAVASAAHRRLDIHDGQIEHLSERQWQIIWKVIGGISAAGVVIFSVIKAFGGL